MKFLKEKKEKVSKTTTKAVTPKFYYLKKCKKFTGTLNRKLVKVKEY